MLNNLPQQYRKDPWIIALVNAMQGVLTAQEASAASVTAQESLDTVSWNLAVEERLAGITPPPGATLDSRRAELKAKWRSRGKMSIDQLQAVADAWENGEVEVSFPSGRIRVQFVGAYGVPVDIESLKAALRLVIPAHLPVDYILRYLLIRDIHQVMTIDALQTQPLSNFAF